MEKFEFGEKVFCLNEFQDEIISAWIFRRTPENQVWLLVKKEEYLNLPENEIPFEDKLEKRENFILKGGDKRIKGYIIFNKYLEKLLLWHELDYHTEMSTYFAHHNNRTLIFLKTIFKKIYKVFDYFFFVIILGIIKLILGDLIKYFPNMHKLFTLNRQLEKFKMELAFATGIGSNTSIIKEKLENTEKTIETLQKENTEINRSIIAIIIAIISLLFSLKK